MQAFDSKAPGLQPNTVFGRSPRSIAPAGEKGALASASSSETIRAFFANQGGNKVEKARRIAAKEQERVRRVERVRANALSLAVETKVKLMLKEKKEAKNEKRYKQERSDDLRYL